MRGCMYAGVSVRDYVCIYEYMSVWFTCECVQYTRVYVNVTSTIAGERVGDVDPYNGVYGG